MDAQPWLSHTWLDLANVLLRRAGTGDHAEAAMLANLAAPEARRLDQPGPLDLRRAGAHWIGIPEDLCWMKTQGWCTRFPARRHLFSLPQPRTP
jgi:hypothetical protein